MPEPGAGLLGSEKMSDIVKQRLRIVNMAGAAVVIFGIAVPAAFGVAALYGQGHERITESARLRSQLMELDGLSKTLDQVEHERAQTEARLTEAESHLPSSSAMDQFLHELAKVAEDAGLQVDSTIPMQDTKDASTGGYKSMPVAISGVGDWETCYRFLTGLRDMKRLTRLDSLQLQTDTGDKGTGDGGGAAVDPAIKPMCRISVTISTFMAR